MKELIYGSKQKTILIPESWEEISTKQYIAIAAVLHNDAHLPTAQLDRLLHVACGKSLYSFLRIPVETRLHCYEHITWMLEGKITIQLLPYYKTLYGPESGFANLVLAEFHHTEMAYESIVKGDDKNEEALNELVAILYREPKKNYDRARNPDGDIRKPFTYSEVSWHTRKVKKWPLAVKQAILLWYDGCRQSLYSNYKKAFDGGKSGNYYTGLYPMIRSLSGDKYGTFEQVEKMSVEAALLEIVTSKEEEAELKRKYPQLYS